VQYAIISIIKLYGKLHSIESIKGLYFTKQKEGVFIMTEQKEQTEKQADYENFGDVNPLDHGGIWVKQINKTEYEIIKNIPETLEIYNMSIDITDSWLEKDSVMSYLGMTERDFDPLWFAIGCTDYYGVLNFGEIYKMESEKELMEFLTARGIKAE
jgi:hypothetical protein